MEILVYTYKEGMLSAVAHDLKLRVTVFDVVLQPPSLRARFDPHSLRVVCARKDGQDAPHLLPSSLFKEVERNIDIGDDDIVFVSQGVAQPQFEGELTLHGRTRRVRVDVERNGDDFIGRARIDQREFGIKPFSAMMGALKIKPHIDVEARVFLADFVAESGHVPPG